MRPLILIRFPSAQGSSLRFMFLESGSKQVPSILAPNRQVVAGIASQSLRCYIQGGDQWGWGVWQLLVMRWRCRRLGCTTSVVRETKGEFGTDSLEQTEIKTQIPQKNPGGLSLVITSSLGSWYYINERTKVSRFPTLEGSWLGWVMPTDCHLQAPGIRNRNRKENGRKENRSGTEKGVGRKNNNQK